MLKRLFQLLLSQILKIKSELQAKEMRPWGFKELFLSLGLFFLEAILSLVKFNILVFKKPSESYVILTNPAPEKLYEYSYLQHKKYSKRISVFSLAGLTTIVATVVLVSLVLNFLTQPALQSLGATFSFAQTSWSSGWQESWQTDYPVDPTNLSLWTKYATSTNIYLANSGADLQIATTTLSTVQTTDAHFNAGTYTSNTESSGSGSVILTALTGVVATAQIAASTDHTCALTEGGVVYCWGANGNGQLGDNAITESHTPVQVHGVGDSGYLTDVKSIDVSQYDSCAVTNSGNAYCWGANNAGQLGDNTTTESHTPVQVHGVGDSGYLTDVKSIDAGQYHSCAVTNSGNAYCWGAGGSGRLGDNTGIDRHTPVQVHGVGNSGYLTDVKSISASNVNTCAVSNSNNAYCWGANASGQIGNNTTDENDVPVQVHGVGDSGYLTDVKNISAGNYSTCASDNSGNAYCWGYNNSGRLGDNSTTQRNTPVQVHGVYNSGYLTDVKSISAPDVYSGGHTCAVTNSGNAYCWGTNSSYQLGDNTNNATSTPIQVHGVGDSGYLTDVKSISVGTTYTCAINNSNNTYCWGSNTNGRLGDNTTTPRHTPVQVHGVGDSGYLSLAAALTYNTPGTYTSGIIDIGFNTISWANLSWTASGGQTITMKARTAANSNMSGASAFADCGNITSGQSLKSATPNCVTDGHRYIQYEATLSTADPSATPSLDEVTIGYIGYASSATFTSSFFDTNDPTSVFAKVIWDEDASLPSGTGISFQVRSAPNSSGAPGTATSWSDSFNNATSSCSKPASSQTVTCTIPSYMPERDGVNDQWIQYKMTMTSDGSATPTVSGITLQYARNVSPTFQNVLATQNSDGTVTINFEVRDTDTDAIGNIQNGYVILSLQYFDGNTWQNAATVSGSTGLKEVNSTSTDTYWPYSITWTPKTDFNGQSTTTMQVRIKADDQEAANNEGYGVSPNFALDTKDPVVNSLAIDSRDNTLTISATDDDANFQMMLSNNSDYSADTLNTDSGNWINYASSRQWNLSGETRETVYLKFKDSYNNVTQTSVTGAPTPQSPFLQDISIASSNAYRIFFSWGVVADVTPAFSNYYVERSISSTTGFSNIYTISDRLINYYVDPTVVASTTYWYHVYSKDANSDYSNYSTVISAIPNGVSDGGEGPSGSTDHTAPVITNVRVSDITTNSATVLWDTNELSDSNVFYGTNYSLRQGAVSYVTAHSVILVGLSQNTEYHFTVDSSDVALNIGRSNNNGAGYTFTTASETPGAAAVGACAGMDITPPVISSIKVSDIGSDKATITWKTDENSDSFVDYGLTNSYDASDGQRDSSQSHTVSLSHLLSGNEYHFRITSSDKAGNIAKSQDQTFKTKGLTSQQKEVQDVFDQLDDTLRSLSGDEANDQLQSVVKKNADIFPVPVIIGEKPKVDATASAATISWLTDREANSIVALARVEDYNVGDPEPYNMLTGQADEFVKEHSVLIPNLYPATTYHFQLRSRGQFGETAKSKDFMFTTSAEPPEIIRYLQKKVAETTATVYWLTNIPTDGLTEYTPFRNGQPNEKETKSQGKPNFELEHEITLSNLEPNITYSIKISSRDANGNQISKVLPPFTTTIDKDPPIISLVKTESAIQQGFQDKIQTIISWQTDEPATTQVVYQEGLTNDPALEKTTSLEQDLTTNHAVVITSFKPATVYSFKVKSADEAGNEALSKEFTILTPRKGQSVVEVIIQNFQSTFGWLKKLGI